MQTVLLLPGDGIGPEIVQQASKLLDAIQVKYGMTFNVVNAAIGGHAIDEAGVPFPDKTLELAKNADAVLLGAVGGPRWDNNSRHLRPETGLLQLRSQLNLFCNLRPAVLSPALVDASSLKPEFVSGLDIMIVRELTGGIYFGEPRGIEHMEDGARRGFNTMCYTEHEIERIARAAFDIASKRGGELCSVDKANVLEVSELWRDVFQRVSADYADVNLSHMYVDNAAMQLVKAPKQFDVIATSNMFGDILSDCAAMLTGSIGMLASASLNESQVGLYEPVHGSAPDIAGKNCANPLATMLSVAMMMKYSLGYPEVSAAIENAVEAVLDRGLRTPDIYTDGMDKVSTAEMGQAVIDAL